MHKYIIEGGHKLEGEVKIHSAKNAILPIMAASLLNAGENVVRECPNFADVANSIEILEYLGCHVNCEDDCLYIDSSPEIATDVPESYTRKLRASFVFLGSILGRCGEAKIGMPGGCVIGERPVDIHLDAFRKMGVDINIDGGTFICDAKNLNNSEICLAFPSVGATENIMLLASSFEGETIINNPAKEPEVVDLGNYLIKIGSKIEGLGSDRMVIHGTTKFKKANHRAIPDRIVCATYLCATAVTGGNIRLLEVCPEHLKPILSILSDMGCTITSTEHEISLQAPEKLCNIDYIRTMPYPGFPTDAQAILLATLCIANGTSIIAENVFESRFNHVRELMRMGANITVDGRLAIIRGVERLLGAKVQGEDLRGTAALIIAALGADGISEVSGLEYFERGYVDFYENLQNLGANIKPS